MPGSPARRNSTTPPLDRANHFPSGENANANVGRTPSGITPTTTGATFGGRSITDASQPAPISTHLFNASTCSVDNCRFGGMCGSPFASSTCTSRLSDAFPVVITGPASPPAFNPSALCNFNPPFAFPAR
jgi:hypothetical protein